MLTTRHHHVESSKIWTVICRTVTSDRFSRWWDCRQHTVLAPDVPGSLPGSPDQVSRRNWPRCRRSKRHPRRQAKSAIRWGFWNGQIGFFNMSFLFRETATTTFSVTNHSEKLLLLSLRFNSQIVNKRKAVTKAEPRIRIVKRWFMAKKNSRLKFVKNARIWSYQNPFVWLEYENPFSEPKGLFWQCDQMARMFLQYLGIYNNSNKEMPNAINILPKSRFDFL